MAITIEYAIDLAERRGAAAVELQDVNSARDKLFTTAAQQDAPLARKPRSSPAPAPQAQREAPESNRISKVTTLNLAAVSPRMEPESVTV